ncbi:MAG: hypothetical protein JOZ86_05440 [Candidatus Eremiobacteraeota bacterium]|nr:hypothetical protein [Candidatus Eremiobacteraeota bacterium]
MAVTAPVDWTARVWFAFETGAGATAPDEPPPPLQAAAVSEKASRLPVVRSREEFFKAPVLQWGFVCCLWSDQMMI